MTECALWYWSHGSVYVSLCEDEAEAISKGIAMSDAETGSVAGIQRSDGTFTDRDHWTEYQAESDRRLREMMDEIRSEAAKPEPARVEVTPPFDTGRYGKKTRVLVENVRPWLGRQVSLAGDGPGGATRSAESARATHGEGER